MCFSGMCVSSFSDAADAGGGGGGRAVGLGAAGWNSRPWFDGPAPHEGEQLVGDLRQHVFSQPRHAQHLVTGAVDVVPERNKLEPGGKTKASS